MTHTEKIGFGGGCHWCTEAVFQSLTAVQRVQQGYIRGAVPNDGWSEAVLLEFRSRDIPLDALIEIHLRSHASTSPHSMRGKYRSAIYVFDDLQVKIAQATLARLQPLFDAPIITSILQFDGFKPSEERYWDYYASNPDRPFCRTYIDPKLRTLRQHFAEQMTD